MYINFWYPAIASKDLSADQPARVQMLGQQFVLFRDANGQASLPQRYLRAPGRRARQGQDARW